MRKVFYLIGFALQCYVRCAPQEDLVDINSISQLPQDYEHKWYSGYLNAATPGDTIYYQFFESQGDPTNDPVLLWLQGGPGCSSLFGLYLENGPFVFYPSSIESHLNEFAWNLHSNMLYIESPAGVGFSQTKNEGASDNSTSADSLSALIDFFSKFPELKPNKFYISGESYAGMYIPFLATSILEYNKLHSADSINLKGFILGNGCTLGLECTLNTRYGYSPYQFQQFHDHAFVSYQDWKQFEEKCTPVDFNSHSCGEVQKDILESFNYDYVDIDNINGKCYHAGKYEKYAVQRKHSYKQHLFQLKNILKDERSQHNLLHEHSDRHKPGLCDYEIGDFYLLNNDTVRLALHIKQSVKDYFWQTCTENNFTYKETKQGSYDLYPNLIENNLKIWIYSGDVDANVPITGTLTWVVQLKEELSMKEVSHWRPWFVPGNRDKELQVGGMVWQLSGLQFCSVRDAGHEVPFWQPQRASIMVNSFLQDQDLPDNPRKKLYGPDEVDQENFIMHFKKKILHKKSEE